MVTATAANSRAERKMFQPTTAANNDSFTLRDWVMFASMAGIWGSSFVLIDIGLDAFPPGFITLLRIMSGAAALWALLLRRRTPRTRIARPDRARVLLLSVIWVAVPFTFFPLAQGNINSSVTGLLNGATPIFAAAVAALLFRQLPRGPLAVGIAVGFAGIILISLPSISDSSSEALGVAIVLGATVCYGFALNLAGPLQQRYGSVPLMARVLTLATVWTAPFGLWEFDDVEWKLGPLVAVLALGVLGTGVAFAVMGSLVGRVGSTRASFITYLIPVVSLTLGVTLRGDTVAPLAIGGIVMVIGGAFLASRARR